MRVEIAGEIFVRAVRWNDARETTMKSSSQAQMQFETEEEGTPRGG
jgi:hypothetical protein